MFKVNNKNTRMTLLILFYCPYCYLLTYFRDIASAFAVDVDQVNLESFSAKKKRNKSNELRFQHKIT